LLRHNGGHSGAKSRKPESSTNGAFAPALGADPFWARQGFLKASDSEATPPDFVFQFSEVRVLA
jgi:hypothetical protein